MALHDNGGIGFADLGSVAYRRRLVARELTMKSVEIAQSIRNDPNLIQIVERANQTLEWVVGQTSVDSPEMTSLSWELERDGEQPILKLRISDSAGSASSVSFPADESELDRKLVGRMIRTWGDLLQDRSHRQMETMRRRMTRLNGEEVLDEISDALFDYTELKGEQPHVFKLPVRYAVALMKLGSSFWGEQFQKSVNSGLKR